MDENKDINSTSRPPQEESVEATPPAAAPVAAVQAASNEATVEAEVLVDVRDLAKHYGAIKAVDGISFSVRRGDILGFMGPNGAGKTTAMRIITGFLDPDSGSVAVAGHDMATESLAGRQHIGYLPENAPAYGEMTVTSFLEFVAEARAVDDIPAAIARVLTSTGLDRVQHQTIDTLSKGFKRRVGLAQALIHDPEVLILDEPTDGLDPNQKAMVQDLISQLSGDKCIILSTHVLDEVERVCNRAMIISQGQILVDSTPAELIQRAPDHNVIHLTLHDEQPDLVATLENQDWCQRVESRQVETQPAETRLSIYPQSGENHLADVLELVRDVPLVAIDQQEGRLDDLFRSMTQGVSR